MANPVEVVLQVAAAVVVVGAYGYATWRGARRRVRRAQAAMTDTRIADVKDGDWVRLTGVVAAGRETTTSPVGGRPCVGFLLAVRRRSTLSALDPDESALTEQECLPFMLGDGSGRAIVEGPCLLGMEPDPAGWAELPPEGYELLRQANVPLATRLGRLREFEFNEVLLLPGARVSIVARASFVIDPAGVSTGYRSLPRLCALRGDKKAPVMVAVADSH